jgi:phenylalanyl-tRNA synthetase alpha chain
MREHSAGHIVHEAVHELFPELKAIEGQHGIGGNFYIKYQGILDETNLGDIQALTDQIVNNNEPINTQFVTHQQLSTYGISLPSDLPTNKPLRILTIGDRDPVPDGGTHVKNTNETGKIQLTEISYELNCSLVHYKVVNDLVKIKRPNSPELLNKTTVSKTNQKPKDQISLTVFQHQANDLTNQLKAETKNQNPGYLEQKYFGKNGLLKQLTNRIPDLRVQDRKPAGQIINTCKKQIEDKLKTIIAGKKPVSDDWIDVTAPAILPPIGHVHLITEAIKEIETIFARLGFVRRRYSEIETDWYYAQGLNIPKDHPARDDQETFYFTEDIVLTAHTSNGQLREMELIKKPPIKMINIGKTYRRQASNTHSPMFHQFEGLLIDQGINMSHLVGVSNYFAKNYFGPDRQIRLRPHHFQFTEPSFEVDINCHLCKGSGKINGSKCPVCKSGWLELGGAGMVHPQVLKNGRIDPQKYSGFAFGWGIERVIMMKHQVTANLRELYSGDLRFLNQT